MTDGRLQSVKCGDISQQLVFAGITSILNQWVVEAENTGDRLDSVAHVLLKGRYLIGSFATIIVNVDRQILHFPTHNHSIKQTRTTGVFFTKQKSNFQPDQHVEAQWHN